MTTLSQAGLAQRVGVQRSAVTQWEQPDGTVPSVDHLIRIALETDVTFEWLATGRGPSRCDGLDSIPPLVVDDYARDEHESQALSHFRLLAPSRRRMALDILEVLAR